MNYQRTMRVVQIGNVGEGSSPHSTENELLRAMLSLGWTVDVHHERGLDWRNVPLDGDFVLWTHTHGFAPEHTHRAQTAMQVRALRAGIPVVGYHLDLWWGLARQRQVGDEPFFRSDRVCTADGGHDDEWAALDVAHRWFPPAVSAAECVRGTPRAEYTSDIAFLGSWDGGYHAESEHRHKLVGWLRDTYGDRVRFWPERGQPAVRGPALRDLVASTKVVVGDSCLVPTLARYWSDRVPEMLGRGALLMHPDVLGLVEQHPHTVTWEAGEWAQLDALIDYWCDDTDVRVQRAKDGRAHTRAFHTYMVRMEQLAFMLHNEGLVT